jgi:hypothetical protein
MMISDNQLATNRSDALLSTGAKTEAVRKTRREVEMRQAAELLQLSKMRGLEYIPGRDGFVFSNDQINAAIDREQRLQRASVTDFTKYKPRKLHAAA